MRLGKCFKARLWQEIIEGEVDLAKEESASAICEDFGRGDGLTESKPSDEVRRGFDGEPPNIRLRPSLLA